MGIIEGTYYASPPQMPSKLIRRNTTATLVPSQPSATWLTTLPPLSNKPMALSNPSIMSTQSWMIAGSGSNREGMGGNPKDIVEREKNTVV